MNKPEENEGVLAKEKETTKMKYFVLSYPIDGWKENSFFPQ